MEVEYINGLWYIVNDSGEIIMGLGGFIDPCTPKIIIKEIEKECI